MFLPDQDVAQLVLLQDEGSPQRNTTVLVFRHGDQISGTLRLEQSVVGLAQVAENLQLDLVEAAVSDQLDHQA